MSRRNSLCLHRASRRASGSTGAPMSTESVSNEGEALDSILARIRPYVRKILFFYRIPYQEAEDIVQDTVLIVLKNWPLAVSKEKYFLGTLHNRCIIFWRMRRRQRELGMELPELELAAGPQAPKQGKIESQLDLRKLTRSLSPQHKAALWLRFGIGMKAEEVAQCLGYSPSSVRKTIKRSIALLQKLARKGDEA
jgi:RNA polymerase sigma factor (sigma-70 family)